VRLVAAPQLNEGGLGTAAEVGMLNARRAQVCASRFRALVLIGVAASFTMPHSTMMPSLTSTPSLAEVEHTVAFPPQWSSVLLASWQELWPKLLAAPPVVPDFEKVRQHVCKARPETCCQASRNLIN
jgi:hypothetical protein